MDPSHVNWLHDGAAGKWENSHPMQMHLVDNAIDAHKVWLLTISSYARSSCHELTSKVPLHKGAGKRSQEESKDISAKAHVQTLCEQKQPRS